MYMIDARYTYWPKDLSHGSLKHYTSRRALCSPGTLRDRINLSKVCATALEKEVIMLEGQPTITDPRIARLLQRLQRPVNAWYQALREVSMGRGGAERFGDR